MALRGEEQGSKHINRIWRLRGTNASAAKGATQTIQMDVGSPATMAKLPPPQLEKHFFFNWFLLERSCFTILLSVCWRANWITYMYTHIPSLLDFFPIFKDHF